MKSPIRHARIDNQSALDRDEYIPFLSSLPPLNLREDLWENLFDNNSKYEGSDSDSAYVNHRSARVFGKSSDDEMSCDEYLVWTGEKT